MTPLQLSGRRGQTPSADVRSVRRLEDERLLAGNGRFHENIRIDGLMYVAFVRSPIAHGRILEIDATAAIERASAFAVITSDDLPSMTIPARQPTPGLDFTRYLQPPLATGWVRHVGEPIAAVVASDPYVAEDAVNAVRVEFEPLEPLLDARTSKAKPVVSLGGASANVGTLNSEYGDVEAIFTSADHIVQCELATGRHTGMPLENRGLTVRWNESDSRMTIWGMTKVPFWNRSVIAQFLALRDTQVHCPPSDVGGSFGIRGELYPEDLVVPWLARELGVPLRWTEDRREHLQSANHAREQVHIARAAFDNEGRLLALDDEAWLDTGAYIRTHGAVVAALTAGMFGGPYRLPAMRSRVHIVATNKTGVGTYRAPGRFQNNYVREHLMDLAAEQLGLQPVEIRMRNLLGPSELPGERPMRIFGAPMLLDGADHLGHYKKALDTVALDEWYQAADQAKRAGRFVGVGTATILEKAGLGYENAVVTIDSSGTIEVAVGATSVGQGVETVMAQITSDVLGVDYANVRVVLSDTDSMHDGGGTFASRSSVVGGTAVFEAARAVKMKAIRIASQILHVDPESVVFADGFIRAPGSPSHELPLAAVASAAASAPFVRSGEESGLIGRATFSAPTMTYPYGAHFALVEVDPCTAQVDVLRYAVTYEIGHALHPAMAHGQITGGVVQGIGGALFEDIRYDSAGRIQADNLDQYRLPTSSDVPPIESYLFEDAPAPGNPLGLRGVGEAGIAGVGAAIANAVKDALPLKGPVPRLPLTQDVVLGLLERAGIVSMGAAE
ncbi:xanthine dehydrogenase family protein molybdopterin-binding subunit [Paenarthrobacter sp. NPDC089675]|uniref:xanthine dehydrogenase family protein molybdopterin-binding subunit n=1 Tax=Paenarthrobacter sp. NPDC089675 TaxID=3364376 RepID=UPI00380B006D